MLDVYLEFRNTLVMDKEGRIVFPENLKPIEGDKIAVFYEYDVAGNPDKNCLKLYNDEMWNPHFRELLEKLDTEQDKMILENIQKHIKRLLDTFISVENIDNERSIVVPENVKRLFLEDRDNVNMDSNIGIERGIPYIKMKKR